MGPMGEQEEEGEGRLAGRKGAEGGEACGGSELSGISCMKKYL